MTFVVTETCIKCKYMDCVEVCPVDCFHEGPNFLVIDPDAQGDTLTGFGFSKDTETREARRATTPSRAISTAGATGTPPTVAIGRATNGKTNAAARISFSHGR